MADTAEIAVEGVEAGGASNAVRPLSVGPASTMSTSYSSGPISRLLAWLDGLPGRGWWFVGLLALVLAAWGTGVLWATGQVPAGTLDISVLILVAYAPYTLAVLMVGRYVALSSLETFWPATGWPAADRPAWVYQFVNTPRRVEFAAMVVGVAGGVAAFIAAPASVVAAGPNSLDYALAVVPIFIAGYGMTALAVVISTRWLLLVMRIHREATAIDPFDKAPIYAFSRMTVVSGLATVISIYYTFAVNAASQEGNVPSLTFLAVGFVGGLIAFVGPLWGIHVRIAREKDNLARDVERRINRVAGELYEDIDSGSLEAAGQYSGLLSTLTSLRERIGHLPTWPWPPNLFRGFVTALLLPIVIYVLTRVIATYVG